MKSNIYKITASRKNSQFNQITQEMRCKIIEAHRSYIIVESLKRYNKKYSGASVSSGNYSGRPIRRINKDQIFGIIDENSGRSLKWDTVRRREGSILPGRSNGGK